MIYYVHGKTVYEFMQKVNAAIKKGHRVVAMGMSKGFNSYNARMDTEPPKGPTWRWQK